MLTDHENDVMMGDLILFHQHLEAISSRLKPWDGEGMTDEEVDRRLSTMCYIDDAIDSMANAVRAFSNSEGAGKKKKRKKLRGERGQSQRP
jgi:hypothetical protein